MNRNESGRSILEILAVLAIMLVLMLGGLYYWRTAQNKVHVQAVTQRLVALRVEHQANMRKRSYTASVRSERGLYNEMLTLTDNANPDQNYFIITVSEIDAALCQLLPEIDLNRIGAVSVADACDEGEEVSFYFPKIISSDGFGGGGSGGGDTPGGTADICSIHKTSCIASGIDSNGCPIDKVNCTWGYCQLDGTCGNCHNGYHPSNGHCCPTGQYWNGTTCTNCAYQSSCSFPSTDADGCPIAQVNCAKDQYCHNGTCTDCPTQSSCLGGKDANGCPITKTPCASNQYCDNGTCTNCPTQSSCSGGKDANGCPITKTPCASDQYCDNGTCTNCPTQTSCSISADTTDEHGCLITKTTCSSGYYCELGRCVNCSPSFAVQVLCRGTPANYTNNCPKTVIEGCENDTPVCNEGNACVPCPTVGESVIVHSSGDCTSKCTNAIEVSNGDGTYTCTYCNASQICGNECCSGGKVCDTNAQSSTYHTCVCPPATPYWDPDNNVCSTTPQCLANMIAAGFPNDGHYAVAGTTVRWNQNSQSNYDSYRMIVTQDLDLSGCNLVVNGTLENKKKMVVNNLTVNGPTAGVGLLVVNEGTLFANDVSVSSGNEGRPTFREKGQASISGNFTAQNVDLIFDSEIHIYGNLKSTDGIIASSTEQMIVDGNVQVINGYGDGFYGAGTIHGSLYAESTEDLSGTPAGIYVSGGNLTVDGNVTGIASQSTSSSWQNGQSINSVGISIGGSNTLRSLNGYINAEGEYGIMAGFGGRIIAEKGFISASGHFGHGIEAEGTYIEAKGKVTGEATHPTTGPGYGICLQKGSELKAGGGVEGTSYLAAIYMTGASKLISCGDVEAQGGMDGFWASSGSVADLSAPAPEVYVKGQLKGWANNQPTASTRASRAIHFYNVNMDKIKARRFFNGSDGGSSKYSSGYGQMTTYPTDNSYTPQWCTQMGY